MTYHAPVAAQQRGSIASIIAACAAEWGVTVAEVTGSSRKAHLVAPRHAAMWIAHKGTGRSLPEIGRAFGRDHTSVLYAVERVGRAEPEMRAAINRVRARLPPSAPTERLIVETMDRAQIAALGASRRAIEESAARSIRPAFEEMGRIASKAGAEISKLLADIGEGA